MSYERHLFLDCDGVFANFEKHYLDIFGHVHNSVSDPIMWSNINNYKNWWTTIPKYNHFDDFWNRVEKYSPTILTGCPKSNYAKSVIGKNIWISRHFGPHTKVITCMSKDKPKYMKNAGDILVDDMDKNCNNWTDSGGLAIKFTPDNWEQVADLVDELMNEKTEA